VGCGDGSLATVTGEVTYEGEPVGEGTLTLLPADGKGPVAGGRITGGRYTVENVVPGLKVVKVEAVTTVRFARSSDEMARRAPEDKARADASGLVDRADSVPADAEGNNAQVELKPGKQTVPVRLKRPPGPRSP
jgi:hypothetical protein